MGKPLRVLIVEDSEDDALLISHELQRNGYDLIVDRVDTAATMTAALEKQTWDIVIADYVMPHFSGFDALKLLQGSGLDLPFIVVSGKIGEDTAIKCSLHTSSYTPSQDNDDYWDDCDNEVSGTGYTHEGVALTSTTVSTSARVMTFDTADAQWTSSTITARYAVIYDSTEAADGDKPLIMCVNFGEDKSSEAGTFQITWNASGLFTITAAAEA